MKLPWTNDEILKQFLIHGWSEDAAHFVLERINEVRAQKIIARMFGMTFGSCNSRKGRRP